MELSSSSDNAVGESAAGFLEAASLEAGFDMVKWTRNVWVKVRNGEFLMKTTATPPLLYYFPPSNLSRHHTFQHIPDGVTRAQTIGCCGNSLEGEALSRSA